MSDVSQNVPANPNPGAPAQPNAPALAPQPVQYVSKAEALRLLNALVPNPPITEDQLFGMTGNGNIGGRRVAGGMEFNRDDVIYYAGLFQPRVAPQNAPAQPNVPAQNVSWYARAYGYAKKPYEWAIYGGNWFVGSGKPWKKKPVTWTAGVAGALVLGLATKCLYDYFCKSGSADTKNASQKIGVHVNVPASNNVIIVPGTAQPAPQKQRYTPQAPPVETTTITSDTKRLTEDVDAYLDELAKDPKLGIEKIYNGLTINLEALSQYELPLSIVADRAVKTAKGWVFVELPNGAAGSIDTWDEIRGAYEKAGLTCVYVSAHEDSHRYILEAVKRGSRTPHQKKLDNALEGY